MRPFLDLCRWGLNVEFPTTVVSSGGRYRRQQMLKCNPENGRVLDDEAAMAFWQREYEPGWKPIG